MAVESSILSALNTRLAALTFSPTMTVSYPNVTFTVPTVGQNAKYLRVTQLPADTFEQGVGFNGTNKYTGIYQVDLFTGNNFGEPNAIAIAEQIIAQFKRGTQLIKNNFIIEILDPPSRLPYVQDDSGSWWMLPIRITYTCYARNPA